MLDRERWLRLSPHLDRALEMDAAARSAWIEVLRESDAGLAADLELLLAEERLAGQRNFLAGESPVAPFSGSLAGQTIGVYTLIAPLGQGGMGSVWRARRSDGRFDGEVAVKLLNAELVGRTGEGRFRREGNILARLTHPNIAHLIDAGVSPGGQPFLALERVEGENIDVYCDSRRLGIEARLRLFLDVLEAVAHAHAHLIVHRDVKPSNVLVSQDGRVKLLDFGIAKLLEEETGSGAMTALTRDGGRALSPAYAAPEQVTGAPITIATDVYSLGALLYLLLTGGMPADADESSPADLMRAIVDTVPERPSRRFSDSFGSAVERAASAEQRASTPERLQRELAGDLDTILAKALKKRPVERYATVAALAEDLRRFLEHRPIAARPDSTGYRMARFVRRHRVPVALAGLFLVAIVAGVAGTLVQSRQAHRQAAIAGQQRDFALRQRSHAEALNDLNSFLLTDAAPGGKPFSVGDLLARAEKVVDSEGAATPAGSDLDVEMLIAIGMQYSDQDQVAKAQELLSRAYRLARQRPEIETRARAACALARTVSRAGNFAQAERLVAKGLELLPEEPQFVLDRVFCLRRGGDVARDAEDPEASLESVLAARKLLAESHLGSAILDMGLALELAESYRIAGRNREADRAFALAAERLEAVGRGDSETAATLYNNWALTVRSMGNPLAAEKLFRRAIEIDSQDATLDSSSPAKLTNFGITLNDLNRFEEARIYAERACDLAHRRGDDVAEVPAQFLRARLQIHFGELASAAQVLTALGARIEALFPAGHPFRAMFESTAGLLAQARRETERAGEAQNRAIAMIEASPQGQPYLPFLLIRRSELYLAQGRPVPARTDAARAVDLLRASSEQGTHSHLIGRAELTLGRALAAVGAPAEAHAAFVAALADLEPTLGADHSDTRAARELALGTGGPATSL
ncbi:MAG: serine/threonine-protein kinase [Thermoanaerobaculia bacterium]